MENSTITCRVCGCTADSCREQGLPSRWIPEDVCDTCLSWSEHNPNITFSKRQALELMCLGFKVTHRHFFDHEWMTIQEGKLVTEDGCSRPIREFFSYRTEPSWEQDYSIFQEKTT